MTLIETKRNVWRQRDNFPELRAAGKVIPRVNSAKLCLEEITPRPVTPPSVKKYINSNQPEPGTVRVFYGKANDPDIARTLVHGIKSSPHTPSGHLINPQLKTQFQEVQQELQGAYYDSRLRAPLGRSQLKGPGLPDWLVPETTIFGKTTTLSNGAQFINPPKTPEVVEKDAFEVHHLYRRSHNSYDVGEQLNRGYDPTTYRKDSRFGLATPHHNDGRNISRCFQWLCATQKNFSRETTLKWDENVRERTHPQIHVQDAISRTLRVPSGQTLRIFHQHRTGERDFLHSSPTSGNEHHGLVVAARQHLKKAGFQKFTFLLQAFRHYDQAGKGKIDKIHLKDICRAFDLGLHGDVLDCLSKLCDEDENGWVNFMKFINLINWKEKLQVNTAEWRVFNKEHTSINSLQTSEPKKVEPVEVENTPNTLEEWHETGQNHFVTSSSVICGIVGGIPTTDYRTFGIPSVRTDLPAPQIHRVGDSVNYGDRGTVGTLLQPTTSSRHGITEEHFFCPRTKEEMQQIFQNVGVNVSEQMFKEAWKLASMKQASGQVCVESFKNVLKELQAY